MKKTLILLAGYPGTGKSYLANLILEKFPSLQFLSPDEMKEKNWDRYGFNDLAEKELLIEKSWQDYYQELEALFQQENSLISDYPFSEKQKERLLQLTQQYDYQVVTIRLVADLDVLYERQKIRDLDHSRHLGHILLSYHKETTKLNHQEADNLVDYEEFIKRCTTRGYGEFSLGTLIELDVTDFSLVDYDQLLREVAVLLVD